MSGDKLFGGSNISNILLQSQNFPYSSSAFHGSTSAVTFGTVNGMSNVDGPHCQSVDNDGNHDDDSNGCLPRPEKKMGPTVDTVQFLEKFFEIDNKLTPERKVQLAKVLCWEPRKVAVWFQNRRAKFKRNELEKEYDGLKASYDKLQADYDSHLKENGKLKNEVLALRRKLIIRESGKGNQDSIRCERFNLTGLESENAKLSSLPRVIMSSAPPTASKQEETCSAKSDVVDSDSPHHTDGNHSSIQAEPAGSYNVFEPEFSHNNDDDSLRESLLSPKYCPELEDESCYLGFPFDDILEISIQV